MNLAVSVFTAVLETSWRVSCLIILLLAARPIFRRYISARVYFWVWLALTARLLIPIAVPVAWSPFNLVHLVAAAPKSQPAFEFAANSASPLAASPVISPHSAQIPKASSHQPTWAISLPQLLALVWASGVALLLAKRFHAHRRFLARLRSQPFQPVPSQFASSYSFRVAVTDAVGAPALHGIFRPQLLFPAALAASISAGEFEFIAAHESTHLRRHDLFAHVPIQIAQIVHWFNPFVWLAARAARQDCELACDEAVVRHLDENGQSAYGLLLLKILRLSTPTTTVPLGLGILDPKEQIKRRIQMITSKKPSFFVWTALGTAVLALIVLTAVTRESRKQAATGPSTPSAHVKPIKGTIYFSTRSDSGNPSYFSKVDLGSPNYNKVDLVPTVSLRKPPFPQFQANPAFMWENIEIKDITTPALTPPAGSR